MDCSPPGSSVHGIFQARVLEWVALCSALNPSRTAQQEVWSFLSDLYELGNIAGEGDGTPLQHSCLENPMDGGAWWAAVHGVAKSRTRLSDLHFSLSCIGEGNGNPLQCSCLENPRDGGASWAAVYGVAQSWTRLKRLSSNSSCLGDTNSRST